MATLLAGIGSVAYHGPGGAAGHALHDAGTVALAGTWALRLARPGLSSRRRRAAALTMALGAGLHAASRTGGPLCRPDTCVQVHGAWHVLSAAAAALVAVRSGEDRTPG